MTSSPDDGRMAAGPLRQGLVTGLWRRGRWWFIGGAVIGFTALLFFLAESQAVPQVPSQGIVPATEPGSSAAASSSLPNFTIIFYQGQDVVGSPRARFHDLLGKRPMVLNLWASKCPPCIAEMPAFQNVHERYKERILMMGLDVGRFFPQFGDQEESKRTLKRLGLTYVAGTPENAQTVADLEVYGLPTTLFITSQGQVYKKWVGALSEAQLTDLVEGLLRAP